MASVAKRKWTHKGVTKEAWVVRYFDHSGKRRGKQFDRKKDADGYKLKIETELASGLHIAPTSRTVADLLNEFLDKQDQRLAAKQIRQASIGQLEFSIRHILAGGIGARKLTSLTWQDVETFGLWLRAVRSKKRNGKPLSPSSINGILADFGQICAYAERRGYMARNPVPSALKELGTLASEPIATFIRDEVQRIIHAVEVKPDNTMERTRALLRCFVYLAAFCGLRRGEVLGLTADCIDREAGIIHVRRAIDAYDVLTGPKTKAGVRSIPLPPTVLAALDAWQRYIGADERGLIFRAHNGGPFNRARFYLRWAQLLKRAEVEPKHFHALRHFAGSAWLDRGVPLPLVSRLMGHANVEVTARVYAHAIDDPMSRAADIIASAAEFTGHPLTQQRLIAA